MDHRASIVQRSLASLRPMNRRFLWLGLAVAACGSEPEDSLEGGETETGGDERMYEPEVGVKTIDVGGIELAYFESGSGPLVVLLHGFPDTPHTWDDLRP